MNMNIRRIFSAAAIPAILIFLVIPFSLLSCGFFGGKIPTRNYYILSALPSTQTAVRKSHPYSLQVDRCDVQRIFSRQNIVYRFSANRIQYYEYQQWAVRPDYMITPNFSPIDRGGKDIIIRCRRLHEKASGGEQRTARNSGGGIGIENKEGMLRFDAHRGFQRRGSAACHKFRIGDRPLRFGFPRVDHKNSLNCCNHRMGARLMGP